MARTETPRTVAKGYHALVMPSYIEHFGLVPFDALAVGVPVLVNEISGAAMFLGDPTRFPAPADRLGIVKDFDARKPRPLQPADYLEHVSVDAFDNRPVAWATAIANLEAHYPEHLTAAANVQQILLNQYSWQHCAASLLLALNRTVDTRQGPGGSLQALDGTALAS